MPKPGNRKFQFALRARVAVPGHADTAGIVVARTQDVTAQNSYRVEFSFGGAPCAGTFGEAELRTSNPPQAPLPRDARDLDRVGPAIKSIADFARMCLAPAPGACIDARDLYTAYLRFVVARDMMPATENRFGRVMGATHDVGRTAQARQYLNVVLVQAKSSRRRMR
jgi:hypothetical protein